jgi:hypothetical protein
MAWGGPAELPMQLKIIRENKTLRDDAGRVKAAL